MGDFRSAPFKRRHRLRPALVYFWLVSSLALLLAFWVSVIYAAPFWMKLALGLLFTVAALWLPAALHFTDPERE